MSHTFNNVYKALLSRETGGRRPGTATGHSRRLYQCLCPSSKVQQLDVPEVHISRFSPCGQYLVCFAGGFTQLVVFRFTGPRVSWQGELEEPDVAARLASFGSFFRLLYRSSVAPAGEVLARDAVHFLAGGTLLLLASHSPFAPPQPPAPGQRPPPPPPDADPLQSLPVARSIQLHVVRLSDGVRLCGSSLEGELVDLGGRPGSLGVSVHEDLVAVLALRSQVVHLLQLLRGGEDLVHVRCLGPHVREDDELVLRTAEEAEERWRRARRAEREAAGRALALPDGAPPAAAPPHPVAVLHPPLHRSAGPYGGGAPAAGGSAVAALDAAAAAAHQAAVRQQIRQRQYEQLAAQAGPAQPLPYRDSAALGRTGGSRGPAAAPAGLADAAAAPGAGGQAAPPTAALPAPPPPLPDAAAQEPPLGSQRHASPPAARPVAPPNPRPQHPHHHPPQQQQQLPLARLPTGLAGLRGRAAAPVPPPPPPQDAGQDADDGGGGGHGRGGCVTGIKQRLLAHLYRACLRAHPGNPRRQQREAMAMFRALRTYESLIMRKVFMLDRNRILIDLRTPASADLGAPAPGAPAAALPPPPGPGLPPTQYYLLFDMQTTQVVSFKASPGDKVIEAYVREATCAGTQPWAEPLPAWDRYVFDDVLSEARRKLSHARSAAAGSSSAAPGSVAGGPGGAADPPTASLDVPVAAGELRASAARKLMQLLPPVSGSASLSSSPYLDTSLFTYDDRMVTPHIGARPCLEQPISFRPRNCPERVAFRMEPGPYQPMVSRGRRLARSVAYLFHPDAPFVMAVFSVFQQSAININFHM